MGFRLKSITKVQAGDLLVQNGAQKRLAHPEQVG